MRLRAMAVLVASITVGVACGSDDEPLGPGGGATTSTGSGSVGATTSASTGGGASSTSSGATGGMGGQATGGASAGTVPCDGGECASSQVCCFDNVSTTQLGCAASGSCGAGEIELQCNHPDDCGPSETCCSAFDGMVQTMRCQATCDAADEFVMCSGPDQSACPGGTTCSPAQAGQGYHYCAK